MDGTVLIADDDRTIRTVLTQALTRAGCKVHATSSLTTLLRWVAEGKGDAVICDVVMPDGDGIEMLPNIHRDRPGLPVIVISAQNTVMTAIRANEAAAFDYLPKPFDLPELLRRTGVALAQSGNGAEVPAPQEAEEAQKMMMIGSSAVMQGLYRLLARISASEMPVLITGPSGSGKSLIARMIHQASTRREGAFVEIKPDDCRDPGWSARAVQEAGGGTLLFDNIGEFTPDALREILAMMDRPGLRFLASTQDNLSEMVTRGAFRADLYYRLNGAEIAVPALEARIEDIPELADHFLSLQAQASAARVISAEAKARLQQAPWPGHVRQLQNMIERLALMAQGKEITLSDVEMALDGAGSANPTHTMMGEGATLSAAVGAHVQRYFDLHGDGLPPSGLYGRILREIEQPLIEISLAATSGNQAKCADLLGINRNTLRKKMNDLDIHVTRGRKLM